jgi:hypothetical protein
MNTYTNIEYSSFFNTNKLLGMEGRALPVGIHLDHSQVRDGGEYVLQYTGLL